MIFIVGNKLYCLVSWDKMHCFNVDAGELCLTWNVRGHTWFSSMEPVVDRGEVYLALTMEKKAKMVKVLLNCFEIVKLGSLED